MDWPRSLTLELEHNITFGDYFVPQIRKTKLPQLRAGKGDFQDANQILATPSQQLGKKQWRSKTKPTWKRNGQVFSGASHGNTKGRHSSEYQTKPESLSSFSQFSRPPKKSLKVLFLLLKSLFPWLYPFPQLYVCIREKIFYGKKLDL